MTEWLNKHPAAGIAIGVASLVVAGVILTRTLGGSSYEPPTVQVYFYDLDADKLFAAENQSPPIDTPSGGDGVSATVYGCGTCDDPEALRIAYLTTTRPADDEAAEPLHLVSDDRGATWHRYESAQGFAIVDNAENRLDCPPGAAPMPCRPPNAP